MTKSLDLGTRVGVISQSTRGQRTISALYQSGDKYYVTDVVPFTEFQEYYAYEVPQKSIEKFISEKENKHLLPRKNQVIRKVHIFDGKILELRKYNEQFSLECFKFSFDGESQDDNLFECVDIATIEKNLLQKTA